MATAAWMWRVAWHDGFGGTHTAETDSPLVLWHSLGHVDFFEISGAYKVNGLPWDYG